MHITTENKTVMVQHENYVNAVNYKQSGLYAYKNTSSGTQKVTNVATSVTYHQPRHCNVYALHTLLSQIVGQFILQTDYCISACVAHLVFTIRFCV